MRTKDKQKSLNTFKIKYNALENKFQYAEPDDKIQYNAFENKFVYTSPKSSLKYNAFENRFEFVKPDSDNGKSLGTKPSKNIFFLYFQNKFVLSYRMKT